MLGWPGLFDAYLMSCFRKSHSTIPEPPPFALCCQETSRFPQLGDTGILASVEIVMKGSVNSRSSGLNAALVADPVLVVNLYAPMCLESGSTAPPTRVPLDAAISVAMLSALLPLVQGLR